MIIFIVFAWFGFNIFAARIIADGLKPKRNFFDVWAPRISLVPPIGIILLLIIVLVMMVTFAWRGVRDIWE